jgi:hypothetical protein
MVIWGGNDSAETAPFCSVGCDLASHMKLKCVIVHTKLLGTVGKSMGISR